MGSKEDPPTGCDVSSLVERVPMYIGINSPVAFGTSSETEPSATEKPRTQRSVGCSESTAFSSQPAAGEGPLQIIPPGRPVEVQYFPGQIQSGQQPAL